MEEIKVTMIGMRPVEEFHHGNAAGADKQAQFAVINFLLARSIHTHPAVFGPDKQIPCRVIGVTVTGQYKDMRYRARPPLSRNKDIVEAANVLIACPKGAKEELRSGTWATVRYMRKLGKPVVIIYPDGTVKKEGT